MINRSIPTRHEWIILEPLSDSDWLVIDRGQEKLIGDGVIGHIQALHGRFETLRLSEPLGREYYDKLDDAVDSYAPWESSLRDTAHLTSHHRSVA
jgi:hypothetical protein